MKIIEYKHEISPTETLKALPVGVEVVVPAGGIKTSTLRNTASKLRKEGYLFKIETRGVHDPHITRLQ